ncbi:hypothetical protein K3740_19315 (plasmid) [Ruegeria conchae]|uniref:hypothetical protein n=1 Tax=Ruegeria conchae TaxID=981384 RepID=UPI00147B7059|nr:hypothetical protein [Ruegeria conchae]UWR05424.1 hypothetical protein K3740_19315 [Ruegeria conchae]
MPSTHQPRIFNTVNLTDFDTNGQTSTVGEPTVSNNGNQILATGNWYASRSLDSGQSWSHMSPFTLFPPADGGFCCDQTTIYDPSRDLLIWLLQYIEQNGTNTLRVAVKQGRTLGNDNWNLWDFTPAGIDPSWNGEWFDYNHVSLSENYLYAGTNVFSASSNLFRRCVILRISLDELAAAAGLSFDIFETQHNFSLRCVQGARGSMYFASHNSNSQIRVFRWPENSPDVDEFDIDVTPWFAGSYSAPTVGGGDWMSRTDPRIMAGWLGRGALGFMWTANKQANRPNPFVRTVRINEATMSLIDEPDIWNDQIAFSYPSTAVNRFGDVGLSIFAGGGNLHPSHVIGTYDDIDGVWRLSLARQGTHTPSLGKWGDYTNCAEIADDGFTWLAAGYTLQGGSTQSDIEPTMTWFSQQRYDAPRRHPPAIV